MQTQFIYYKPKFMNSELRHKLISLDKIFSKKIQK